MILLCGIPSEPPLALVRERLTQHGIPHRLFNQRRFDRIRIQFEIACGQVTGLLELEHERLRLEDFGGVYLRLMDDRALPELRDEAAESPRRRRCRALHDALMRWCEIAPLRVVNRMAPMATNSSKPYQAQIIRQHGFAIPETLITNDPERVKDFQRRQGRVVYKSTSGVRSIVQTLGADDLLRLDRIRWCPTQFQAFVPGTNVRVHVVGDSLFATAIHTEATDYRYAERQGSRAQLVATELPTDISQRCIRLARAIGLDFAGIDLKLTPEGLVYCFEVNPSPAFSYYEANTGQPISLAVANHLAGLRD